MKKQNVFGRGGNAIVCKATGISRITINKGRNKIQKKMYPILVGLERKDLDEKIFLKQILKY